MSRTFLYRSRYSVPVETLFGWHEKPAALERLNIPWAPYEVVQSSRSILNGSTVELRLPVLGPIRTTMKVMHEGYEKGVQFQDREIKGPFRSWLHTHRFSSESPTSSILEDTISYSLPAIVPDFGLATRHVEAELNRTFWYRHQILSRELEVDPLPQRSLSIAITGSSGLIGQSLIPSLSTRGHRVIRILRQPQPITHALWNPATGELQTEPLEGIDALVHLAGENIAKGLWTTQRKELIRSSRVDGTKRLVDALGKMKNPPKTLVMASAIGLYGAQRKEPVDETTDRGDGFLADIVEAWEAAARPALDAGMRVVFLRFGVVLSARGGVLSLMMPAFKSGVGGPLGSGQQWMNWLSIEDVIRLIHTALSDPSYEGAYNAVAPAPVTNEQFTKEMGKLLKRPTIFRVPAPLLRTALGQMAEELMLANTNVIPRRLQERGFRFTDPTLETCLRLQLGCPPPSAHS